MPDACEELAEEMLTMLRRVYVETDHTTRCAHRYMNRCTCWKSIARPLIKKAMQAGLKGESVAPNL